MTDEDITDGEYTAHTVEEILDNLITIAESDENFGEELDADTLSVIRAHYDATATELQSLQEKAASILDAAQIENATGGALDKLAEWKGVTRSAAAKATGRLRFSRSSRATTNYTIPASTIAQTDTVDAVSFETDSAVVLGIIEDFEDNDITNYSGDTGDFSTQTGTVQEGTYALQANAVSGSDIWTKETTFGPGTKFHVRVYINTGGIGIFRFALTDATECYQVRVDEPAGAVELEDVVSGSASDLDTSSVTVPTGEWLDIEIDWQNDGVIDVNVDAANGSDLTTLSATDTSRTSDDLGFGFKSGDASATKFFDMVTQSAISVDATATESGSDSNVGANVLTVMPDAPSGIESVTNPSPASGGSDKESDDDYRARATSESGDENRGTVFALINQLESMAEVTSVTVVENDTNSTDGDGRPAHSVESIVQVDSADYDAVAQTIAETKAAGIEDVAGYGGTAQTGSAEYSNGQSVTINFSTPTEVTIYMDVDLTKTSAYAGDDAVADNVVRYIGGVLASGETEDGELEVGDDVIYNEVIEAIMSTDGVFDITNLELDDTTSPTGTSNFTIASTEQATTDASDAAVLDISSTDA